MGMTKKVSNPVPPIPNIPQTLIKAVELASTVAAKERAGDDKMLDAKTQDKEPTPKVLSDFQKPWLPAEVRRNDRRDILDHVLLSPVLAQRSIGLNQADAFKEFEAWFAKAVEVFYGK